MLTNNWLFNEISKDSNWHPCKYSCDNQKVQFDPDLSDFGNMVAKDLYLLEVACGISMLHNEIFLVLFSAFFMFAVELVNGINRLHTVFSGIQASGKSHIMSFLMKVLVPGIVKEVGEVSKLAHTGKQTQNGLILFSDELGEQFTGIGDGSGNTAFKQILSKGGIHTKTLLIDQDSHDRNVVETYSEVRSMVIGNTNLAKFCSDSMQDRFYFCTIIHDERNEKSNDIENERLKNDPEQQKLNYAFQYKMKVIQCFGNLLQTLMRLGIIPDINVDIPNSVGAVTYEKLSEKFGCIVAPRDRGRLLLFCKCVVIYRVINQVFFSGKILPIGTKFNLTQLFLCVPLMYATREDFYFALTMQKDIVSNPVLPIVLNLLKIIINEEPIEENKYARRKNKQTGETTINYNYFLCKLQDNSNSQGGKKGTFSFDYLYSFSEYLYSIMKNNPGPKVSTIHIYNVLKILNTTKIKCKEYLDSPNEMSNFETIKDVLIKNPYGEYAGVEILKQYFDQLINEQGDDISISIIKETFDMHMDLPKKIILGQTHRFSQKIREVNCPFLFKVYDTSKINKDDLDVLYLHNKTYRPPCYNDLFTDIEPISEATTQLKVEVNYNLENHTKEEWCKKNGFQDVVINNNVWERFIGDYPKCIKERYIGCFERLSVGGDLPENKFKPLSTNNKNSSSSNNSTKRLLTDSDDDDDDETKNNKMRRVTKIISTILKDDEEEESIKKKKNQNDEKHSEKRKNNKKRTLLKNHEEEEEEDKDNYTLTKKRRTILKI